MGLQDGKSKGDKVLKVLLINADCEFNLAIRKMYTYYTKRGDIVMMQDLHLPGYPHKRTVAINGNVYDMVAISNVFEVNADKVIVEGCSDVRYGGIGSRNSLAQLPPEIEECEPYYYHEEDMSWGFITRGCVNKCYFCKVPTHEGALREYRTVEQVVRHKKVRFLDNNILAYDKHMEVFQKLIDMGVRVDFNQGLDFRRANDENMAMLARLKYIDRYIFAFDDWKYRPLWEEKIQIIKRHIPQDWKIRLYVYVNPAMPLSDTVNRIEWCREHKCLPYIMRDAECYKSEHKDFYTDLAAYCNQPAFFKKMDFETFLGKRHKNADRIAESLRKWVMASE